ncbi:glycosyltransferase family 2 protein [Shimia sediminis]|uniref:glycosyltransferase family 2 protein n=1 Tax=Shimia sediminis TaxID=2497945 RepID=UPI000F8E6121|nr:glycosyltransferase family 2 protein [Shimia sediminis]
MTRWGVVATIKAPPREVLNFVAYHLELGADHLFIYLDNQNPTAQAALDAHPQVTVTRTDGAYWRASGIKKPVKHQPRQTYNATHAYQMATDLDWLVHIDVDEFLCPADLSVSALLDTLPPDMACARVRPAEALATDGIAGLDPDATYCKAWIRNQGDMRRIEADLYPDFGGYFRAGFVSHTVGKIFLRTGLGPLEFRIHRAMVEGEEITPRTVLDGIDLCHRHIADWDAWQKVFDFRMDRGSYREGLKASRSGEPGGMTINEVFTFLLQDGGQEGLRRFYEEVCLARPALLQKLEAHGLLRVFHLDLARKRKKHFQNWRR